MEDKQDDFYQYCRADFANSDVIRFFLQQEEFTPIKGQQSRPIKFPFAKMLYQCVNDLAIVNTVVRNFTRTSVKYLDNGREISNTKDQHWNEFINNQYFTNIRSAYLTLSFQQQQILKYKVLALSNMLFKMGMNMSKISLILLQKKITYPCLSVFSLSVAFLQFLQFSLFKIKKMKPNQTPITLSLFLRQLLKISVIKISHRRNNDETNTLETSQYHFLTKHSSIQIRNVQYIQLYQQQDTRGPCQRKTDYQHIFSYNMKNLGLKAPYSFDFYYFFKSNICNYLKEFNPDVVLWIQDHKNQIHCIEPEARSLVLSQVIENITPKIYYFRQFGAQELLMSQQAKNGMEIQSELILTQINPDVMNLIQKKQCAIFAQIENSKMFQKRIQKYINNIRINTLDDILGISLILTQRQKLDKILEKYQKHCFDINFIENFLLLLEKDLEKYQNIPSEKQKKGFHLNLTASVDRTRKLLNRLKTINSMSDESMQSESINRILNKKSYFNGFHNVKTNQYQPLITLNNEKIWFTNEDQIYIKYLQNVVIVFISKQTSYCILKKTYLQSFFTGFEEKWPDQFKGIYNLKGLNECTIVCTDQYLYKGFGVRIDKPTQTSPIIYRYCIKDDVIFSKRWQVFAEECVPLNCIQQKIKTKIQSKIGGYSFYDQNSKRVIMIGGYLFSSSEQKVCKQVYTFTNDQNNVEKIGKSNNLIIGKIAKKQLFPFVFGMPFTFKNQKTLILNTNGYYQFLLNNRKIFQSEFQGHKNIFSNGITTQSQLEISPQSVSKLGLGKEQQKLCKDKLMDLIILSGNYNNYYDGKWVIQTDNKLWQISMTPSNPKLVQIDQIKYFSFKGQLMFQNTEAKLAAQAQQIKKQMAKK